MLVLMESLLELLESLSLESLPLETLPLVLETLGEPLDE